MKRQNNNKKTTALTSLIKYQKNLGYIKKMYNNTDLNSLINEGNYLIVDAKNTLNDGYDFSFVKVFKATLKKEEMLYQLVQKSSGLTSLRHKKINKKLADNFKWTTVYENRPINDFDSNDVNFGLTAKKGNELHKMILKLIEENKKKDKTISDLEKRIQKLEK